MQARIEPQRITAAPSKEAIRAWLAQRSICREPLPDTAQIKRELGWRPPVAPVK